MSSSNLNIAKGGKSNQVFSPGSIFDFIIKYGIYFVFILLVVVLTIASPAFLTIDNMTNVLLQLSVIGMISVGMTFVIIVRGIDVSVGSIVALSSVIGTYYLIYQKVNPLLGILIMILVSVVLGLFNGIGVAYLKMPAFIVTLATMQMARGVALAISGGQAWYNLPPLFKMIGNSKLGPVPLPVLLFALCALTGYIILSKTVFGKQVYAVGGNPVAAKVSGINVDMVILLTFLLSGIFVGISSVTITSRMNCYFPQVGQNYEFDAIASVVIGGTSLFGGEGWIGGTILGVLIMGVINNALNLLNVSPFFQLVAKGLIIFLAVLIDTLKTRSTHSR